MRNVTPSFQNQFLTDSYSKVSRTHSGKISGRLDEKYGNYQQKHKMITPVIHASLKSFLFILYNMIFMI